MFRRITHLIIAFVLLLATTGFSVSKHNCNMDSEDMILSNTTTCCVNKLPDCCYTKTEYIHLETDFISSEALQLTRVAETEILFSFVLFREMKPAENLEKEFISSLKFPPQVEYGNQQAWLQTFSI